MLTVLRHRLNVTHDPWRSSAVSVAAVADAVDGDGVGGFVEEDAVIAGAEPEESFELALQWLDAALAGLGIPVNGFQNVKRGLLFDRSNLALHVGTEANLLHAVSVHFADLIHREATARYHVFE
jgi:hypothetical protein